MEYLTQKIVGTWKLVSWTYIDKKNNVVDFFGKESSGILMYDNNGYMNAQLMRFPRKAMAAQRLFEGSLEEIAEAYKSYAAYYGRYEERQPGEFIHVVEGSLFPNWTGQEEVRFAKIEGEFLTLSAPPVKVDGQEVVFNVLWKRVTA
jgi:hypothetical protein